MGVLTGVGLLRGIAHMAGLGEEGIRIRSSPPPPRRRTGPWRSWGRGGFPSLPSSGGKEGELIIHVQGVTDPQGLLADLQGTLR